MMASYPGRGAAALVLAASVAAAACGQYTLVDMQAPANRYGKIEIMHETQVMWVPMQPLELKLDNYQIVKNGATGWLCLFPTGQAGGVYYIDAKYGARHDRYKITITGEYTPPDDDDDERELTGLAKQIFGIVTAIGDDKSTRSVAQAIRQILDDERITTADAMHAGLKAAIPKLSRGWKPAGDFISRALNKYGNTANGARETLEAVYQGLVASYE